MGSKGGSSPNAYRQHTASTLFLRVPVEDWAAVSIGAKTEFRSRPRSSSRVVGIKPPTPVVAYSVRRNGETKGKLMVLEDHRFEPLFALTEDPDGLRREGFETYNEFRRYWRKRNHGKYRPLEMVHVFKVRLWSPATEAGDHQLFGAVLLDRLYGEWL